MCDRRVLLSSAATGGADNTQHGGARGSDLAVVCLLPPPHRPMRSLLLSANQERGLRTRFLIGQEENQCDNSEYEFVIVTQLGGLCPPESTLF